MANEVSGINMLVEVDGTAVTAQSDATLSAETELAEAVVKSTNFNVQESGDQDWSLSYEGQITDTAGKHALVNGNASLEVGSLSDITGVNTTNSVFTISGDLTTDWSASDEIRVIKSTGNDQFYTISTISYDSSNDETNVTVNESISDSTADGQIFKPQNVRGLQSLSMNFEQELNAVPAGVDENPNYNNYNTLRRTYNIEGEGHYYDPRISEVFQISSVDSTNDIFTMEKDVSGVWDSEDTIEVRNSSDNNGQFTISSVSGTDVTVQESVSSISQDGSTGEAFVPYDTVYNLIHDARDNGENLGVVLTVLGVDFSGEVAADSMEIEAGSDDTAQYSLTWQGSGEVFKTGTAESTVDSLFDLYFNQSNATASLSNIEDGTDVSGSTYWEGNALLSTLEISLERNSFPEISTELQGDGILERKTN